MNVLLANCLTTHGEREPRVAAFANSCTTLLLPF